jgi:hypothetical protein
VRATFMYYYYYSNYYCSSTTVSNVTRLLLVLLLHLCYCRDYCFITSASSRDVCTQPCTVLRLCGRELPTLIRLHIQSVLE